MRSGVSQEIGGAATHRFDRTNRLENAVDAVVYDLRETARFCRHHRHPARHRFQRREAERLGLRGQHEEVGRLEDTGDPVEPAQEEHVIGDGQFLGFALRVAPIRTIADHQECRRHRLADPGEHPHHVLHPLDLTEIGDVGDDLVAGRRQRLTLAVRDPAGIPGGSRSSE